jgi:hypothetical protein
VPQRDAPEKLNLPDLPIRALPIQPRLPTRSVAVRLAKSASERAPIAAGFARSIDRPPRA